ncbi:nicotinamide mononucleotide transporter [bacterium]|nr:nicotinamide mononucleotide transporter [bacterium]
MPEINIEWLGWIATIILLVGYYLNAKKKISSWYFWFFGNVVMLVYAILIQSYSVAFLSMFLMGMNIYGYLSWRRDE